MPTIIKDATQLSNALIIEVHLSNPVEYYWKSQSSGTFEVRHKRELYPWQWQKTHSGDGSAPNIHNYWDLDTEVEPCSVGKSVYVQYIDLTTTGFTNKGTTEWTQTAMQVNTMPLPLRGRSRGTPLRHELGKR